MAKKFILKKSSLFGKRPNKDNILPGEIALNTNSADPGAFFQVVDGNVVKIGPTAVSQVPPVNFPERGESWLSLNDGTLHIGSVEDAVRVWKQVAAPYLGGGGTCVFVAPEFRYSTDGILNDGQALPFQTITRAIVEITKVYLSKVLAGFLNSAQSNRYTIIIANSVVTANNGPGVSVGDFDVDFSTNPYKDVTSAELAQFNSLDGGIIVPFGISIQGVDLKKSLISPCYVPTYKNSSLPEAYQGINQPLTAILKCSGNSLPTNFSATDKISYNEVIEVISHNSLALFRTERPHGRSLNEAVQVNFSTSVDQTTGIFTPGTYYCIPYDTFRFYLSPGPQGGTDAAAYVAFSEVPDVNTLSGPKFTVESNLRSAHRLRLFGNASFSEIGDFYTKVQKAFSSYFGGKVTDGPSLVNTGDYVIVGPATNPYPDNESSNTVRNSSLYVNQVNLRSEYGMCWGDFDGSVLDGFKSVIANSCTAVSIQNDPSVYEIFTTLPNQENSVEQKWWNLTVATYYSIPVEQRPALITDVTVAAQLDLLNSTPINNIRYYYQNIAVSENGQSLGIVDIDNDFRHFGFRARNGAYAQLQSVYTIGPAIGVWSLNGGICNLTNSTSNFGSISFRAEGFLGINSIGGANANSKGFVFEGVQRPLAISRHQAENTENKNILSLGSAIKEVYLDSDNPHIQIIELKGDFSPNFILPYSLKPGSAVWVDSEGCTYRGFFATDGGPTVITGINDPCGPAKLRLRSSDSTIPNNSEIVNTFGILYIRRFSDPRQDFDRSYSLYLKNTLPTAVAPQVGSVLRLNQTSQQLGTNSLRPNVQFDPGLVGGWGRVFTVDAVKTGNLGASPQFNYVIADTNQDLNYYVAVTASDYARPWTQGPQFKTPAGFYTTHKNRNWYSAENNQWNCMYYGDEASFNEEVGPYSVSPTQPYSPFVDTSVLDRQDPVSSTYQGDYAADPYISLYPANSTYYRGATSPYPAYATAKCYDDDDSSEDMGLCLKNIPDNSKLTYTVSSSVTIQTELQAQDNVRYRPAIIEFSVLSSTDIPNPKQRVSVVQITSASQPGKEEFIRIIGLNGTMVRGIRLTPSNSFYPSILPTQGTNFSWPALSAVKVCTTNPVPESSLYDPFWAVTKSSVLRLFEILGYSNSVVEPFLVPKPWGERLFPVTALNNVIPENGYATTTDKWPMEFNQPSELIANTHTWGFTGYYNYSRGLVQYRTTDITKKLAADFQASTVWSGRLTVTGINDKGEIVQFGPQRQALTANYYNFIPPTFNPDLRQLYEAQPYVEYPSQVSVFCTDNISDQFTGSNNAFNLTRANLAIPNSQLMEDSMLVVLGASVQKPGVNYSVSNGVITFTSPVPQNLSCDIRVITSADDQKTLVVVPLKLVEVPNGSLSNFTAISDRPGMSMRGLDINSENTFIIVGGIEQIPGAGQAYVINRLTDETLQIVFTGPIPAGTTVDIRSFCTGSYWANRSALPVSVYSLDSISSQFDGSKVIFDLTYGGFPVDPNTVTQENLIFSLGGAIQIPGQNYSYTVLNGQLILSTTTDAPKPGTTCNLRLISNAEFITCQLTGRNDSSFSEWGPGLVLDLEVKVGNLESEINF